ncbi:MAG: PspC domain-containing protein [Chloroflexi bacterium]|nr:PspC domain-containing protein [Chloroflexota bacterium]
MEKRLYRSRTDRLLWGVCGGLAKYFNLDSTLIRIIFVLLVFASGIGILAYLLMAIIVPLEESRASQPGEVFKENVGEMKKTATELGRELRSSFGTEMGRSREVIPHHRRRNALGIILIIVGVLALLGSLDLLWWWRWSNFWPMVIIAIGILFIVSSRRH